MKTPAADRPHPSAPVVVKRLNLTASLAACLLMSACGATAVEIGAASAGSYTFNVAREGPVPAAGVATRFVLKSTDGGNPTSVTGWVGVAGAEGSTKSLAVFDPADGDFDDDVVCPSPLPTAARFYFEVTTGDARHTGSGIALQ